MTRSVSSRLTRSLTRCALLFLPLAATIAAPATLMAGQYASPVGNETSFGQTSHRGVALALAATSDFPGVTGRTTIAADRNTSEPAVILTVKAGPARFVGTVTP